MVLLLILVLLMGSCHHHLCSQRRKGQGNGEATIIFAGDITFDGPVKYFAEVAGTCDYMRPFDKIKNELLEADLRVANLESPLMNSSSHMVKLLPSKNIHHLGNAKAAVGLKYAGIDVIQLANNHMADYGTKGIKSTMETLDKLGISYIGVSDDSMGRGEQRPLVRIINGVKVGMLAYCWNYEGCGALKCDKSDPLCNQKKDIIKTGPASFLKSVALKEIAKLKKKVDIVIVLMHWGREKTVIPALKTRLTAHDMKLAGANVIVGTHPHVVQVTKLFKGSGVVTASCTPW